MFAQELDALIRHLGASPEPGTDEEKFRQYRGLVNQRLPYPVSQDYLDLESRFLAAWRQQEPIYHLADCQKTAHPSLYLWQGDITRLAVDAIVNAANSAMLGCFEPNHYCIDNQIHTFAGVGLRLACADLKKARGGKPLPVGQALMTSGFNLPAKQVIHTVGPRIHHLPVSPMMQDLLKKAYRACLACADQAGLATIAFCCISTGEFSYPIEEATPIAIETVSAYLAETGSKLKVIFNVWTDSQYQLYHDLLNSKEASHVASTN